LAPSAAGFGASAAACFAACEARFPRAVLLGLTATVGWRRLGLAAGSDGFGAVLAAGLVVRRVRFFGAPRVGPRATAG
jgi:hypothetical protein